MQRARRTSLGFSIFLGVALTGCGGETTISTSNPTPSPAPTSGSPQLATAQFEVTVPAVTSLATPSAHVRKPQYVSTGTRSVAIGLTSVDGSAPPGAVFPTLVVIGGANCAPGGDGTTCTANVSGFAGTDVYTVTTYATANGTGTPLSSGTVPATLTAGGTTTVAISDAASSSLAPVASAIALSLAPRTLTPGVAGTAQISVNELDASGAFILGTAFASPVTLSAPAGTRALALLLGGSAPAATIAVTTSSVVTVSYDGSAVTSPDTFVATAAGPTSTALGASVDLAIGTATTAPTSAPTTPGGGPPVTTPTTAPTLPPLPATGIVANVTQVDVNAIGATSTFLVGQNGFGGPFTAVTAPDPTIATAAVGADGATFIVTGVAVGTTSIAVGGANGQTLALPIYVTQTPLTIDARHRK